MAITYDFGASENEYIKDDTTGKFVKHERLDMYGLSTDTKPTEDLAVGATFFEVDTSNCYIWTGTIWKAI